MEIYDREKIINRITDLFWEKGYEGTTMHEIIAGTGLNLHSIYREFGYKEKVYSECIDCYVTKSFQALGEILPKKNFMNLHVL